MVNLKDNGEKIDDVFGSNSKEIYEVPLYQRPYSWGEEEINQFCDDIFDLEKDSEYLLGSIILVKNKSNKNKFDIIDGQQRLTTIAIFLAMFKYFVSEDIKSEIEGRLNCRNHKENKLQRLKTQTNYDLSLRKLLNSSESEFFKDIEEDKSLKKNRYYKNAKQLFDYLERKQSDDPSFDFDWFYEEVLLEIYLIRIVCDDISFAMKTFEVLNDRGLPLKNSDLIKNELFSELDDYDEDSGSLNNTWNELVSEIEDNDFKRKEDINDIFTIYIYSKLGTNPKKSNFDEFKVMFKDEYKENGLSSLDFITDFSKFVSFYTHLYEHSSTSLKRKISAMSYLKDSRFWKAIIMAAYKNNLDSKKIDSLIDKLFSFYYLNLIAGISVNRHKNLSFKIIKQINKEKNKFEIGELKLKLDKFHYEEEVLELVNSKLNGDLYKTGWEKSLLLLIEYYYLNDEDENSFLFRFNDRKIQIEHIFPQNPDKDWEPLMKKDLGLEEYVGNLGNLTLLYGTRNKVCSNKSFKEKIQKYKGINSGQNTFIITNKLIGSNYNTWNSNNIKKRSEELFGVIEKIFNLKRGTLYWKQ